MKNMWFALILIIFISNSLGAQSILSQDKLLILKDGIVEVVVPKLENENFRYERELPWHLLPFKERNDKYYSIGTAFFVSDKELVSAAHVFSLGYFSYYKEFFIRDREGNVHKIGNVTKYSEEKDLIQFELESYPEKVVSLEFSSEVKFGLIYSESNGSTWQVGSYREEDVKISKDQLISYSESGVAKSEVTVQKPKNISLDNFINNPVLIAENLLKGYSLTRSFSGEEIRVIDFGAPEKMFDWIDENKRKWRSSRWQFADSDYYVYLHCLPYPKGVHCLLDWELSSHLTTGYMEVMQDAVSQMVIGYEGSVSDWVEFLSLSKDYLPDIFMHTDINFDGQLFTLTSREFEIKSDALKISEVSSLHFHMGA